MEQQLTLAGFRPLVNQKFTVTDPHYGKQELLLISAEERSGGQLETFSLIFTGSPEKLLPQSMHSFSHPHLGEAQIFITPVQGSNSERILYQAVFNRMSV